MTFFSFFLCERQNQGGEGEKEGKSYCRVIFGLFVCFFSRCVLLAFCGARGTFIFSSFLCFHFFLCQKKIRKKRENESFVLGKGLNHLKRAN